MFVFDLYPYMMFDFRFGEPSKLQKPRISQAHYTFAQMRNLTRTYKKDLGFWVGTYNPAWFEQFLCDELEAKHWAEREMSVTAVAQGADFLLTGYKIPVDSSHWDSFGQGLRLIQKAGARLLDAPKVKAKACMLFPRTHYIQMQEEYFNVGLSFELFLRAFGELDILHEEQVKNASLDGYEILVLFDVKALPEEVARHISDFVKNGGMLLADCVPNLNEFREPMAIVEDLFGVSEAETGRIRRSGHWVPHKTMDPVWANRVEPAPDESVYATDTLKGTVLGHDLDLTLISPRSCAVTNAEVLLQTSSGQPGVIRRKVGRGQVFLLGFCLQDTYFNTWKNENVEQRRQLRDLLGAAIAETGVRPHVRSSNPDIEASLRANDTEGFLFVINHEAEDESVSVSLSDLGLKIGTVVDLETGQSTSFQREGDVVRLDTSVSFGEFRLFHLMP
jgi:hypothetical protein